MYHMQNTDNVETISITCIELTKSFAFSGVNVLPSSHTTKSLVHCISPLTSFTGIPSLTSVGHSVWGWSIGPSGMTTCSVAFEPALA